MSSQTRRSSPIRSLLKRSSFYSAFKQLGHYPDYWYWKVRGEPRRIPHLLKQRAVLEYARAYRLTTLVETGTYYGEMIAAVGRHFQRIYSIELDARLAKLAQRRFSGNSRVEILEGDSQKVVPQLLQRIGESCLWWLDAGYCGWTGELGNPNRLGSELNSILSDRQFNHVVLMDDADGVNGKGGSLTLEELIASIQSTYPEREVEVKRNIIRITPRA